jgi:hypothetical protein
MPRKNNIQYFCIMPTFYDYFRTNQLGSAYDVECIENLTGSCPKMMRKLYVNPSIVCHDKCDICCGPPRPRQKQSPIENGKCDCEFDKLDCYLDCDSPNNSCSNGEDVIYKKDDWRKNHGEMCTVINDENDEQWTIRWNGGTYPKLCHYDEIPLNYIRTSAVKLFYRFDKKVKILPDTIHLFSSKDFEKCSWKNIKIVLTFGRIRKSSEPLIYFSDEGKMDCVKNVITWDICKRKLDGCMANFLSFDICFIKRPNCDYIPKFEFKFEEFNTDMLSEWMPSDYNRGTQYPNATSFADKAFFYNSRLALEGEIFKPESQLSDYPPIYHEGNYNARFNKTDPTIPGPYPFEWPWSQWGGDAKYGIGQTMYSGIAMHWGHMHMMTLCTKINILLRNKCSPTKSQDKTLDSILNGSTIQILYFTGITDDNGNVIPHETTSPKDQLIGLFNMLITGKGTACDGNIDINKIITNFQSLKDGFASQSTDAQQIIDDLSTHLNEVLRRNMRACHVQYVSWDFWVKSYRTAVEKTFESYRKLYQTNCRDSEYCRIKDQTNKQVTLLLDHANQVAAILSVLYTGVALLDIIFDVLQKQSNPSIPPSNRLDRVKYINNNIFRFWKQNLHFFDDYCKSAALCREDDMFRSMLSLSESYAMCSLIISEILRAADDWVRQRDGFNELPIPLP